MANGWVESSSGWVNWVAMGPTGSSRLVFSHEIIKKNAKSLEKMNQINHGNELHIITFFIFFVKWAPTIIKLFVLLLYMRREKNKQTKNHKTFHILPILIVLCMTNIFYTHNNKIFHANNSQVEYL